MDCQSSSYYFFCYDNTMESRMALPNRETAEPRPRWSGLRGLIAVLAACSLLLFAACSVEEPPASEQPEAVECSADSGLQEGIYTRIPTSNNDSNAFYRETLCSIRNENTSVDIATFKITNKEVADELIDAHERGVAVRIVADDKLLADPVSRSLQKTLGSDTGAESFIHLCDHSCFNPGKGVQHAKIIMFGDSGRTVLGSTNLSSDNLFNSSGVDLVTDDPNLGSASLDYMWDLVHPASRTATPGDASQDGKRTVGFSPYPSQDDDPIRRLLNRTECSLSGEKTTVDIVFYDMTWGVRPVIERIAKLAKNGCDVRVVINGIKKDPFHHERIEIATYLGQAGAQAIHVASDKPKLGFIVHDKLVVVSDPSGDGKRKGTVLLGSQNATRGAVITNSESMVRSTDPEDVTKAAAHARALFDTVKDR